MANKDVFGAAQAPLAPAADAKNAAGGAAYALKAEETLASLACTGTFNQTYYSTAKDQLDAVRLAADGVTPHYLAQCALYARQKGGMKDMPAALMVMLTRADPALATAVFDRVIDNGKQVRNYVQMTMSGAFGRKGFSGSAPKRLVARWLSRQSAASLLRASVGNSPSLSTIIRLAHVKPKDDEQRAAFGYLRGLEPAAPGEALLLEQAVPGRDKPRRIPRYDASKLPGLYAHLEAFKAGQTTVIPDVDFRFLAGLPLSKEQWAQVAKNGRIMQTFKNLNTYARHGAFDVPGCKDAVAAKLKDRAEVQQARLFPYQLLAAYINTETPPVPFEVRDALQDAMELATEKVQAYGCPVATIVDVSGSMSSPVTGHRQGATSKVRCVDVAGLIGAVLLRRNPGSVVLPVDTRVHPTSFNPRDSVVTLATALAKFGGGGTALGAGVSYLNQAGWKGGLVFLVSDMESWADRGVYWGGGTFVANEFEALRRRNPGCKLVALNLQAGTTAQASNSPHVLNLGGFSDAVFDVVGRFVRGEAAKDQPGEQDASAWVREVKSIDVATYGLAPKDEPEVDEAEAAG